jgi:ribosome biogenesis protein ERB1
MAPKKAKKAAPAAKAAAKPTLDSESEASAQSLSDANPAGSSSEESEEEVEELESGSEEEYDSAGDDSDNSAEDSDEISVADSEDGFEDQGSDSDAEDDASVASSASDESDNELESIPLPDFDTLAPPRAWSSSVSSLSHRSAVISREVEKQRDLAVRGHAQSLLHVDDLSSDDEEGGNTIGRVPLHWYDEYDHIGYGTDGSKIAKPKSSSMIDNAIDNADGNKKYEIYDELNGTKHTLTPREIEILRRIQAGAHAHPEHDANPDFVAYYSSIPEKFGLNSDRNLPKANFQPSKRDARMVRKLLKSLKDGKIDMDFLTGKKKSMQESEKESDQPFQMWKGDEEDELANRKGPAHIAAPKMNPPGHAESYRPPGEYIPTEEELKEWEELDPEDRPYGHLIPKSFDNLRSVGAYENAVRDRFERCLDLYLCPRAMKRRLNIDPESLVPTLPKAQDLKPFPTVRCLKYLTPADADGNVPRIRGLTVSPDGQWLASSAEDGFVRLFEVHTGKLLHSWNVAAIAFKEGEEPESKAVASCEFNPMKSHHCLLVTINTCAIIIATGTGSESEQQVTDALLAAGQSGGGVLGEKAKKVVTWERCGDGSGVGPVVKLALTSKATSAKWHRRGDYFVTVTPKANSAAVLIHQLSKGTSQQPFSKSKGDVACACFHPSKPFLFVANNSHIRIYHLIKQTLVKKLVSGCKQISDISVHPSGDHVIIGSLDRKMSWFDLDLSSTPYKTLKYHEKAIRSVAFHPRYPLMASGSDDGNVHIFHATVYDDLLRNPLIVPVKVLRDAHEIKSRLGALRVAWHPVLPWVFTCGADGEIVCWQDV